MSRLLPLSTLLPASPTTAPRGLIKNELAGAAAKNACVAATSNEHTSSRRRGELAAAVPSTLLVLVVMVFIVVVVVLPSCLLWCGCLLPCCVSSEPCAAAEKG